MDADVRKGLTSFGNKSHNFEIIEMTEGHQLSQESEIPRVP